MTESLRSRLRRFTCDLLERRGALIDWPETREEGLALLPPGLAQSVGQFDILPLSFQPTEQGLAINLGGDFLDRMAPLVKAEPRVGVFRIDGLYLKKSPMEELVAKTFTWLNSRVRVLGSEPARIEYHTWHFVAEMKSDDHWEELVTVTVNSSSGGAVDLPDPLALDDLRPYAPSAAPRPTFDRAVRHAVRRAQARCGPFVTRQETRLERDRCRIRDYYGALLRETKLAKARHPEQPAERQAKQTAVELEKRRKLLELEDRYRMTFSLTPIVMIRLDLPVLAVQCDVARRQSRKIHRLYWNPLVRALEPLSCASCGDNVCVVAFRDDDVLPLCPACHK